MKIENVLWLLPVVFMIHDFEEIIMMKPWMQKNSARLQDRFPALASRLLPHFAGLSTSAFALAVAEEFVLLSALTWAAVEFELYNVWAGLLLGFALHLAFHAVQFLTLRSYVPVILTSILSAPYCAWALWLLASRRLLAWPQVLLWTVMFSAVIIANVGLAHRLARRFQGWLNQSYLNRV